jgi:hypothetical protein
MTMDIADINSCQLATFVGNQSIGVMDSAVSFSPSNNSAIVNGQIHFGSIGILPHPPALLLDWKLQPGDRSSDRELRLPRPDARSHPPYRIQSVQVRRRQTSLQLQHRHLLFSIERGKLPGKHREQRILYGNLGGIMGLFQMRLSKVGHELAQAGLGANEQLASPKWAPLRPTRLSNGSEKQAYSELA